LQASSPATIKALTKTTTYPILSLQAGTPARAKGFNGSSPATIKTLTKTTNPAVAGVLACNHKGLDENNMLSYFILAGGDACKGERVQWFLACNNKGLDENNNLSHFILARGTPARAGMPIMQKASQL